jgi:hypothetical protein
MSEKQTFLQIRAIHNLNLEAIAQAAQAPVEDIYYLEAGVPYPLEFAERALGALSTLIGEEYTRETVGGIYVLDEDEKRV